MKVVKAITSEFIHRIICRKNSCARPAGPVGSDVAMPSLQLGCHGKEGPGANHSLNDFRNHLSNDFGRSAHRYWRRATPCTEVATAATRRGARPFVRKRGHRDQVVRAKPMKPGKHLSSVLMNRNTSSTDPRVRAWGEKSSKARQLILRLVGDIDTVRAIVNSGGCW